VTVDPGERELLAQFLGKAIVRLDVDRPVEEECLVETVQLPLDRFGKPARRSRVPLAQSPSALSRSAARIP